MFQPSVDQHLQVLVLPHEYYMILPVLTISMASERKVRTSVQSCGFTCLSDSIRALSCCMAVFTNFSGVKF